MTPPVPGNPCSSSAGFRHENEHVQSKPIPASPEDRSMAGKTIDTSWRRQPPTVVEKSLSTLKKRATSGDSISSDSSGDSFVIPPKKRRVYTGRSDDDSAFGVPAQTHRYDTAKPSCSNEMTGAVTSEQPLQQEKLMQYNAIRASRGVRSTRRLFSHALAAAAYEDGAMDEAETSAAGAARAKKKKTSTNANMNRNKRSRRPARELVHRPLHPVAGLNSRLEALGVVATDAQFVCMKTLHNSDVSRNQNRLLFSCKRVFLKSHPITRLLREKDAYFVFQHEHGLRLRVSAYDGEGREFGMKLRYLDSNGGYRLIGAWGSCVEKNELAQPVEDGRRVHVELWAFRSPMLPEQPELKDRDRQDMVEGLRGDPKGKLGLLFLPYVDDGEGAEEGTTVHETTKRRASAKAASEVSDRGVHVRASRDKMNAVEGVVTFSELVVKHGKEAWAEAGINLKGGQGW